jgi:hypothetical protein
MTQILPIAEAVGIYDDWSGRDGQPGLTQADVDLLWSATAEDGAGKRILFVCTTNSVAVRLPCIPFFSQFTFHIEIFAAVIYDLFVRLEKCVILWLAEKAVFRTGIEIGDLKAEDSHADGPHVDSVN